MSTEQIETAAREIYNLVADHEASHWSECGEATRLEMLAVARAVIAAIHPTVTTAEELDALPPRTRVISGDYFMLRSAAVVDDSSWIDIGTGCRVDSHDMKSLLPCTVWRLGGAA